MCHVCEYFIVMAHLGGFLSCWDLKDGKLHCCSCIKSLVGGEVSRITISPNTAEREVCLASSKGCIFAKIDRTGYIVEDLFEIYF